MMEALAMFVFLVIGWGLVAWEIHVRNKKPPRGLRRGDDEGRLG